MAQTEKRKLLRAGVIYTGANILLKGVAFFTLPLFIRLLTPEEFGRFNVFISFEGIIFMFSGLTLHASIKNAKYDKKDDYDSYIKNCIYVDFFNSLIIALIANLICFFWQEKIDLNFYEVNLLTIAGFCAAATSIYSNKLVMDYKAGDYAVVSFISVITGIILSLIFIFTLFDFDHYLGRVLGLVLGEVIAAVYVLWRIFREGFSSLNISHWKYGLKISLPIVPHGLSQVILSSANRIMIKYFYNATKAGIFSFTYTVSLIPQVFFQSVAGVWEPWFFECMSKNDTKQIKDKSNMFCLLISFVFIIMSYITPEIVIIMATDKYLEAIDISIIVLMGCYFATLYNIPCEVEYYYKKTLHIATSTIICALVNIGLNMILMNFFSYKIAAYVTLLAYFLYFLFHMLMAYYIRKEWIFDIKTITLIIIISLLLMMLSLFLINYMLIRFLVVFFLLILVFRQKKVILQMINEIRK